MYRRSLGYCGWYFAENTGNNLVRLSRLIQQHCRRQPMLDMEGNGQDLPLSMLLHALLVMIKCMMYSHGTVNVTKILKIVNTSSHMSKMLCKKSYVQPLTFGNSPVDKVIRFETCSLEDFLQHVFRPLEPSFSFITETVGL